MSALGQKATCPSFYFMSALPLKATEIADIVGSDEGQSTSALSLRSNVDLLRYGKGIVHIDAEIPDSTLYLGAFSSNPRRNAATKWAVSSGDLLLRNPITGIAGCCARAASGHATAVPGLISFGADLIDQYRLG
jgi:hypothetical protein